MYPISYNDIYKIRGQEHEINQNDEELVRIRKKDLDNILSEGGFDEEKYVLKFIDRNKRILKVVEKNLGVEPKKRTVTFSDSDLDENLMNKKSDEFLYFYSLKLRSYYKERIARSFEKRYRNFIQL